MHILIANPAGFIALVVIGLIILALTRRRRRNRPHMITRTSPTPGYASPNIPPATLTPFAYQPPEHAQPHEPLLMNEAPNVGMYPPATPIMSEKRKPNLLQRPQIHNRGPSDATISTTPGSSIRSHHQTTTSGLSSTPPPSGFHQPVHKSRPPQSHQRSLSGNSETASFAGHPDRRTSVGSTGGAASVSRVPISTPPHFGGPTGHPGIPSAPMIHEETPPTTPMQNQGFRQYGQNLNPPFQQQSHSQTFQQPPQNQGFYQGQQQGYTSNSASNAPAVGGSYNPHLQHQTTYHAQNVYVGQGPAAGYSAPPSASTSSRAPGGDPGGGSMVGATVDRGDGEAAQVFARKNTMRNEFRGRDDDVNDSMTNLSELPPAYASLRPRNQDSS